MIVMFKTFLVEEEDSSSGVKKERICCIANQKHIGMIGISLRYFKLHKWFHDSTPKRK